MSNKHQPPDSAQQVFDVVWYSGSTADRRERTSSDLPDGISRQSSPRPASPTFDGVAAPGQLITSVMVWGAGDSQDFHTTKPALESTGSRKERSRSRSRRRRHRDRDRDRFENATGTFEYKYDRNTDVATVIQIGPDQNITDPMLFRFGIKAQMALLGSEGDSERHFKGFRKRDHPASFFTCGRVFRTLWVEEENEPKTSITAVKTVRADRDVRIFSKVREFVVIREADHYCTALPIILYGRRGANDPIWKKSDHSIIYTGKEPPKPFDSEEAGDQEQPMRPGAIRVNPDNPELKLDPASRIDYARVLTVHHNVKVQNFGTVQAKSTRVLIRQFREVWMSARPSPEGTVGSQPPESTAPVSEYGNDVLGDPNVAPKQLDVASDRDSLDLKNTSAPRRSPRSGENTPVANDARSLNGAASDEDAGIQRTHRASSAEIPDAHVAIETAAGEGFEGKFQGRPQGSEVGEDQHQPEKDTGWQDEFNALNFQPRVEATGRKRSVQTPTPDSDGGHRILRFLPLTEPPVIRAVNFPRATQSDKRASFSYSEPVDGYHHQDDEVVGNEVSVGDQSNLNPVMDQRPRSLPTAISLVPETEQPISTDLPLDVGLQSKRKRNRSIARPKSSIAGYITPPEQQEIQELTRDLDLHRDTTMPNDHEQGQNVEAEVEIRPPHWLLPKFEDAQHAEKAGHFARQLRRLRRKVDDVLQKRTQWRYDVQRLEYSRQYLHESLTPLMTALKTQHRIDVPPFGPRVRKKKRKARTSTSSASTSQESSGQVEHSSSESETVTNVVKESGQASLEIEQQNPIKFDVPSLYEQYMHDYDSVTKIEDGLKTIMTELNDQEYSLQTALNSLIQTMQSAHFAEELRQQMLDEPFPATDYDESSHAASEQENLPQLVAEYFSRAGDINVFSERLQELEDNYEDEKAEREFQRDFAEPGSWVDDTEKAIEDQYLEERNQIESDLQQARADAAKLAKQCELAGLDPDDYRLTAQSVHGESLKAEFVSPHGPSQAVKSTSQIESWLKDVDDVDKTSGEAFPAGFRDFPDE